MLRPTGMTGKIARASASHPWSVVTIWAVVLAIGMLAMLSIGDRFTLNEEFRTDLEARVADNLITDRLNDGVEDPAQEFVIVSSTDMTVDNPAFEAVVRDIASKLGAHAEVSAVATYYETGQDDLVSFDRHRTVIITSLAGDPDEVVGNAQPVLETIHALHTPAPGFEVLTLGTASVADTITTTAEAGLARGETIGIVVALIVMAIVFGTLVAAGLPIVLTVVSLGVTMSAAVAVSHLTSINESALTMIIMIGLAVGIDYALFIISRYREERERGRHNLDAITRAGDTSSKAVLFSGMTVIVSLMGMLVVPWNLTFGLGIGSILVVVISLLMTLTLLPSVLSLLGDRIDRGRIPFVGYQRATASMDRDSRFWNRISRTVMRRPLVSMVGSAGLLLFLGSFAFSLNLGYTGLSILPESSDSIRAFTTFENEFPGADYQPATIVIEADDVTTPEVQHAIDGLLARLDADPYFGVATLVTSANDDLVRIDVDLNGDGESSAAIDAVKRLRDEYIPPLFDGTTADAHVAGDTAFLIDVTALVRTYLPIIFGLVLAISFILLLLAFRSIVIPVKAITMNLLSVFASYGMIVLVFQKGVGADLLGFRQVEQIDSFIPLVLFTILFGLSMDYHVFLLSRIKEQFDITGDNEQSVANGLQSTGRLITGAALIMVGVFGGFTAVELSAMQQFGFGLAVAVFLDATIVRMILVPASMTLLGTRNWYLPAWLAWLPRIQIEGTPEHVTAEPPPVHDEEYLPEPALAD